MTFSLLAPGAVLGADTRSEVAAAYAAWDQAFNTQGARGIAATYTPDALLLPPTHDVVVGPAAIEAFFAGVIGSGVSNHHLELIEAGSSGRLFYGAARWSAVAKGADGTVKNVGGLATHVFERGPGNQLKLKVHIFN
jgi:ketosteroid isomerase-like protein